MTIHNGRIYLLYSSKNNLRTIVDTYGTDSQFIWQRQLFNTITKLLPTQTGSYITVGKQKNKAGSDGYIALYDQNFIKSWELTHDDGGNEEFLDALIYNNKIYIVGIKDVNNGLRFESFVKVYDLSGNDLGIHNFAQDGSLRLSSISATYEGIYVAGEITDNENTDLFIAKFE